MCAKDADGGYHAIKGFLFQFDKTIIEIINNPSKTIGVERVQDIDCDQYHLQVKHRECATYAPSRITKPVTQLLDLYQTDNGLRLRLYCHFQDQAPRIWTPSASELRTILGSQAKKRNATTLSAFSKAFVIEFCGDYEEQFSETLTLIQKEFSCSGPEAVVQHSLLRSYLLDIARKRRRSDRTVSLADARAHLADAEEVIAYRAYATYLDRSKYEKLVKARYFTFRAPNIEHFERLFVVEVESPAQATTIEAIVQKLATKYFRPGKSPPPFIAFRVEDPTTVTAVKRRLVGKAFPFEDGTRFNGDVLHPELLQRRIDGKDGARVRFVDVPKLPTLLPSLHFDRIYEFYIAHPTDQTWPENAKRVAVQIQEADQVLAMLG